MILASGNLIISKLDWMRNSKSDMQKKDISLLASSSYDEEYVNKWTIELGLEELLREVING